MRNPVNVLKSLEEKSYNESYKYERLYRNLYNTEFYLLAYKNIATSQGSMTAGTDGNTLDGMSLARIERIIASLKNHSYQPNPARRTYIAKKNSDKKRPLGIPSTNDKLVQEIIRMILEAIYEQRFSDSSHGFRPNRSCHTALIHVKHTFKSMKWIVEGDIKACFDSFDHHVLINILRQRIQDEYFIALMWKFLRAGYMEQWEYNTTYSGSPQGSGMSPILANIYMSELDKYMKEYKAKFDIGVNRERKGNPKYLSLAGKCSKLRSKIKKGAESMSDSERRGLIQKLNTLRNEMLNTPRYPAKDPEYKRIQYNRYADDFIIGIIGSKEDATRIKSDIKEFLQDRLQLTLSEEKTKITHSSERIRYLGYDMVVSRDKSVKKCKSGVTMRAWSGTVRLFMPKEKWFHKLLEYEAMKIVNDITGKEVWKPLHRGKLMNKQDIEIISKVNAEIRGMYNFYQIAENVSILDKFSFIMEYSMYKTYAAKYKSTVSKIIDKYSRNGVFGIDYLTKAGPKRCEFYHDGFKRSGETERIQFDTLPQYRKYDKPNSLAARIRNGVCEYCGQSTDDIRMHHVRKLADLTVNTSWELLMLSKRRKSLALCPICFEKLCDGIL
ncbi:MAG: reverse transcriptase domain-containing protein [Lachnospiraceae bacterium]